MKMLKSILLIIFSTIICQTPSIAQIIGSEQNGQSTPKEVKASEITAGGVSGDVNLFTGTFNASYSLGAVSTPTGLSFEVTTSYNSTFATGDNLPHVSGVPYGEGWDINLPSISVSVEDYNKYTLEEKNWILRNPTTVNETFIGQEVTNEGRLFWFSPMLNIPGVASGRMVYKYSINNTHYFVLHKFERYIEATFSGQRWEVVVDDGTRYEFNPTMISHRSAVNQRIHPTDTDYPYYDTETDVKHLMLPQTEYLTWHCSNIYNSDLIGHISFSYYAYGSMDFYKVYEQPLLDGPLSELWGENTVLKTVYKDIFIKEISSGYERMQFKYTVIPTDGSSDILSPSDPDVEAFDDLYSKKMVYEVTSNLTGWRRYKHLKSSGINPSLFSMGSQTNPYLAASAISSNTEGCNGQATGLYLTEPLGALEHSFSHGFLESPRLIPNSDGIGGEWSTYQVMMPPGEIYEIKTNITSGSKDCLFDINLATGDYSQGLVFPQNNTSYPTNCSYSTTRGQTVFSTFNQGIKWHSRGDGAGNHVNTSNFFVMPNLPRAFKGFNIQIGPANSDNNFSQTPAEISAIDYPQYPEVCKSYFNTDYLDNISLNDPSLGTGDEPAPHLYYTKSAPSNFGVGLPWHILLGFYGYNNPSMKWCSHQTPYDEDFWWNDNESGSGFLWPNEPTLADENTTLNSVKIIRYSKNPLMLTNVQKQIYNPGETLLENNDPNSVYHTVLNYKLEYSIETTPQYVNYFDTETNSNKVELSGYYRNIVKLMRIRQLPNDAGDGSGITDFAAIPTTHFEYSAQLSSSQTFEQPEPFFLIGNETSSPIAIYNFNANYILLTKITDPLGKETIINYFPYGSGSYSSFKFLRQSSPKDWSYDYPYFGKKRTVENVAFQVYMTVSSKTVVDRRDNKTWTYSFGDFRVIDNEMPMSKNFRWDKQYSYESGYGTATVTGPAGPDGSPVGIYTHLTDRLLWGKLSRMETKDGAGNTLSLNEYTYESVLAFEPPYVRLIKSTDNIQEHQDYGEYIFLVDRPLPENYTDLHNYYHDMFEYIESLNEPYQAAINSIPVPGPAPMGQCQTGSGTISCSCADYESMDPASQTACDNYWASWQTYLNQLADANANANEIGFFDGTMIPNMSTQTGVYAVPSFYEAIFYQYILSQDPIFLRSYFIKKTGETSTVYDLKCGTQNAEAVQNITTYEYFDADYKGTKLSGGYAKMGIQDQVVSGQSYNRLNWEPSWQLYKKTTTSPQLPGFENTEEYFYLYDLINHQDYQRLSDKKPENHYQMLTMLLTVKKKRDFLFEKRVTKKAYKQPTIVQSVYYIYDKNWEAQLPPEEIIEVDNPYGNDGPCTNLNSGNGTLPCVLAGSGQDLEGLCVLTQDIYCPCEIVADMNPNGGNLINEDDGGEGDGGGGGVLAYLSNVIAGKYFLRQVFAQVRDDQPPVLHFEDDLNDPVFETEVLSTYLVHTRNSLGQVILEEDEKQLKTKYDYGVTKVLTYDECINGFQIKAYQVLTPNFRAPKAVTVGEGLPDALTTQFSYNPDYTIKSVTDPNGTLLSYDYDGYQRMILAYRNGVAIQKAAYSNWQNDFGLNFKQRALQDHVDMLNYVEEGKGFGVNGFLDPIGRKVGSVSTSTHDGNVVVEDHFFDIYDRPVSSSQPFIGSGPQITLSSINAEQSCNLNNIAYDIAPRTRPLEAAKFGLCLNGGHSVQSSYCIVDQGQLKEALENAGNTTGAGLLIPGALYFKTQAQDEDHKTVVEYTNAIGQKIASIAGNGSTATVFEYNVHGQASRVVNPEMQTMTYAYNYLGRLFKKETPDESISQMAYNASGQLILSADADAKFTAYAYDAFGRMIKQVNPSTDNGLFAENGSPWIEDRPLNALATLINSSPKEKEWFYEQTDPVNAARIHTSIVPYLNAMSNLRGRVAQTTSYDEGGIPIEFKFFSFDDNGFVDWEIEQFKDNGLSSAGGLAVRLDYNNYNRQGSFTILQVDIALDGAPDFTYYYEYDSRNRIKEVTFTCPATNMYNFHIASYGYHPTYLTVAEKRYHDQESSGAAGICKKEDIDDIQYEYDIRQRLTNIHGNLFSYHLAYDAETVPGSTSNYNGNINGTIASYTLAPAGPIPGIFQGPTQYGYTYDQLNRLVQAQADIVYQLDNMSSYSGNPQDLGDCSYTYDKVGNILNLTRGIVNTQTLAIGPAVYDYGYSGSNNRLMELRATGNAPVLFSGDSRNYSFLYWNDGSLKSDSKRQINDIAYMRANLVSSFGGARAYLYDSNDSRVFKNANGKEYYLRSSAGQELAILNLTSEEITWYIYGNERIGKIGPNHCELQYCRPEAPTCTSTMATQQQNQLAALNFITNSAALEFPTRLMRVQFCDDTERYLLLEELKQLTGNYHILQQIILTEPYQVLTVQTTGDAYQALLPDVLSLRLNSGPLRLEAYHVCETQCDAAVFTCPEFMRENQEQSIDGLRTTFQSVNPATWPYPLQLFRIRLCGGKELYAPGNYFDEIEGAFTILQTISIGGANVDVEVTSPEGNTFKVSMSNIGPYLADTDHDYRFNGYEPCYGLVACNAQIPACGTANYLPVIALLDLHISQTLSGENIGFPQRLYRIRLCNGRELYTLESELEGLEIPYVLLQEINLLSRNQELTLELTNGMSNTYSVNDMFGVRASGKLESINGYASCSPTTDCDDPVCTETEANAQLTALNTIKAQWPALTINQINFPTTIYRVRLCGGAEEYLLAQELTGLSAGNYYVQQELAIQNATAPIDFIYTDGLFRQGTMADFLSARLTGTLYSLNDYIPCRQRLTAVCNDIMDLCSGPEGLAQNNAMEQIINTWPIDPSSVSMPTTLTRVRLCNDQEVYLLPAELALLPGPLQIIQTVSLSATTAQIATYYEGQQHLITVHDALRLRGKFTDFTLLGYGCTINAPGPCVYTIEQTDRASEGIANTRTVRHKYTKLVTKDCGSGAIVAVQEPLENIVPAEKTTRVEFGGMQDKTAYLYQLLLGTRNLNGTLTVDLNPGTVLTTYPGLSGTLNPAHLTFNYASPQNMATAVRVVIEHAIEQWRIQNNLGAVLYYLQVSISAPSAGSGKISIVFSVYHQPTLPYVALQPTVSTLSGFQDTGIFTNVQASVDGAGSAQVLAQAGYLVAPCNTTIQRDYLVTIAYGSNQVTPDGWYTIENGIQSAVPVSGQTSSTQCQESPSEVTCTESGAVCLAGACQPCLPQPAEAPLCSPAELTALAQALSDLDQLMLQTTVNNIFFPIVLYRLRFCDGSHRYAFDRELGSIDASYVMEQRLVIRNATDLYRLVYNGGANAQIGALGVILSQRPGNNGLRITALPHLQHSGAGGDPLTGDNPGGQGDGRPQVSYYNYDHLGNTRILYHSVIDCGTEEVHYVLEYVADYYPFGSTLREWENCEKSRFLFTYKERDAETGWDNLGARMYDSDLGRFLGVDILINKYFEWNSYTYGLNNPIHWIDSKGTAPEPPSEGIPQYHDDTGTYFWNDSNNKYWHVESSSYYEVTSESKSVGNATYIFNGKYGIEGGVTLTPNRPDYDGFVSVSEGIAWAKAHPNALEHPTPDNTLYLDASKLDFGNLSVEDFHNKIGVATPQNLLNSDNLANSIGNEKLRATVYALGRVDMILHNTPTRSVSIVNNSATDYDWNKGGGFLRNSLISGERARAGLNDKHGFKTYYYGRGTLNIPISDPKISDPKH